MARNDIGISIYFYEDCIRFWKQMIFLLGKPKYIHLFLNRAEKQLFIQSAERRDKDAFKVTEKYEDPEWRYLITCKHFIMFLAAIIGVPYPSQSLFFPGRILEDGKTVFIDLTNYKVIPYAKGEVTYAQGEAPYTKGEVPYAKGEVCPSVREASTE